MGEEYLLDEFIDTMLISVFSGTRKRFALGMLQVTCLM